MITQRIIGLDPGGTTGWATYSYSADTDKFYWDCGQLGPKKHHLELEALLEMEQVKDYTIVCESFEYRNASRAGLVLVSNQYIGVVENFCQKRNVKLVMQTASVGKITKKSFVKKENLEKLDLWVKGGGSSWSHAMDAYGHILQYMIKNDINRDYLLHRGWK